MSKVKWVRQALSRTSLKAAFRGKYPKDMGPAVDSSIRYNSKGEVIGKVVKRQEYNQRRDGWRKI